MCRFCEQTAFGQDIAYDPQLGRGGFAPGANMPPDLILYDGPIITMDPSKPTATAIALREGVIQAVGRAEEVLAFGGRMTRISRLEGRALVPGFVAAGARLPTRRDAAGIDAWIEDRARAGFTTIDLAGVGDDWAEHQRLAAAIDRRHRLRLRGAIGRPLASEWRGPEPKPGQGNDLMRLDAVLVAPGEEGASAALDHALSAHAQGWAVVFDCPAGPDLSAAVRMAELAPAGALASMRLVTSLMPEPAALRTLSRAGIELVREPAPEPVSEHAGPAHALTGSDERIAQALEALTVGAARIAGVAAIAGRLRPGLYADFTVLDRSPFGAGGETPNVVATWIEGVPVRAGPTVPRPEAGGLDHRARRPRAAGKKPLVVAPAGMLIRRAPAGS